MLHLFLVSAPGYGHVRPMLSLAINLLIAEPELYVTFYGAGATSPAFSPPFERELGLWSDGLDASVRDRLKVVLKGEGKLDRLVQHFPVIGEHLPGVLEPLLNSDSSGDAFQQRPSCIIVDVTTTFECVPIVKNLLASLTNKDKKCPLLTFTPFNIAFLYTYIENNETYPEGHAKPIVEEVQRLLGEKAADRVTYSGELYKRYCTGDELVRSRGLPEEGVYYYELHPQDSSLPYDPLSFEFNMPTMFAHARSIMESIDGTVVHSPPALEPGLAEYLNTRPGGAFGATYYQIGPQFPAAWWNESIPESVWTLTPTDAAIKAFLDQQQPNSVLYVSFGTTFFPVSNFELWDALVETLIEAEIPVVWAGKRTSEMINKDLFKRAVNSGRFHFAGFVAQQAILDHTSTGWFLSHSGSNGVAEAVLHSVPLVLWPLAGDQPFIAPQLSRVHKVAFEFVQVRTGTNIGKPTGRGIVVKGTKEAAAEEMKGVWSKVRGKEGEEVRERMKEFAKLVREECCSPEGAARKEFDALRAVIRGD